MTVFVKTGGGVYDVEVSGKETVGSLYKKAACATGLLEGKFKLIWEGNILDKNGDTEVQDVELVEGCVVDVEANMRTVRLEELKDKSSKVFSELEGFLAADPELVLEVEVGDQPAVEVLSMKMGDLPSRLQVLVVTDSTGCVTSIDNEFLCQCSLTSIDLLLPNVSSIGDNFLSECEILEAVGLSSITNASSIGDSFLSECTKLNTINLSSMTNLLHIGNFFLSGCEKLETINLCSLTNLFSIGSFFLNGCEKLESIDMSSMAKLTSIDVFFLSECENLEAIDFSSVTSVSSVGHHFLSRRFRLKKRKKETIYLIGVTGTFHELLKARIPAWATINK
eukprot:TRINITY_DN3072_c1_g2_i1.p1 TRINITY_DN3072_c1_g2~~TRINITY_DN3072_c1_g2_i1.p1  ORF type:complete len:337 (+),score=31.74 TRINITY_DN3072_c1_g2_i1:2-1012(+)